MKIAMIGAGGMGKTHIENIRLIPGAQITDICDVGDAAAALARSLGAAYHTDHERMLERTQAQVVLVCTPTFLHAAQVRAALAAGKHCICEKPLCFSAREAGALFDLARRQGVQLFAAHVMLFWDEYAQLSRIVREQPYGRLLDLHLQRLTARPAWLRDSWLFDRQKSGLLPYDLHIHDLYFLISLLGKPAVRCLQRGGRPDAGYDEYLRVCYDAAGVSVCAEASWYNAPFPFTQCFRACFESAVAAFDGKQLFLYEAGMPPRALSGAHEQPRVQTGINVPPTAAYLHELTHFLDCARKNVPSDIVTRDQVIWTLETLETL